MSQSAPSDREPAEIDLRDDALVDMPTAPMPIIEEQAQPAAAASPAPVHSPTSAAPSGQPSAADLIAGLVRDTRVVTAPPPSSPPPPAADLRPAGAQPPPPAAQPLPPAGQPLAAPQPPPPPGRVVPPVADALPYPGPGDERSPLILIGAGVGIGLLLLLLGVLATKALGGADVETAPAPTGTPSAVSAAIIAATASSTQDPEGGITYSAENTLDGQPETAWNSDGRQDGKGPGMVLTYRFADPVDLATVTVLNGYQKTTTNAGKPPTDLYTLNSRVRGLRVTTDAGSWTWELADGKEPQTLTKAFGRTSSVRFEVLSIYPGTKYLDLAISEVSFGAIG